VTSHETITTFIELDFYRLCLARNHRLGVFVAMTMREIQYAPADPRNFAIWVYVIQAHGDISERFIDRYFQSDTGATQDLDGLVQLAAIKYQRSGVVPALIGCHLSIGFQREKLATAGTAILRRRHRLYPGSAGNIE
jgi:hypothetical protein